MSCLMLTAVFFASRKNFRAKPIIRCFRRAANFYGILVDDILISFRVMLLVIYIPAKRFEARETLDDASRICFLCSKEHE
jgi:hypothetical protein